MKEKSQLNYSVKQREQGSLLGGFFCGCSMGGVYFFSLSFFFILFYFPRNDPDLFRC